jgi:hypothetical protein
MKLAWVQKHLLWHTVAVLLLRIVRIVLGNCATLERTAVNITRANVNPSYLIHFNCTINMGRGWS